MKLAIAGLLASTALAIAPAPALGAAPSSSHNCYGVHGRTVCDGYSVRPRPTFTCLYVSRQTLEYIGWHEIFAGAFLSGTGLFASGTIAGLPVGAVLGLVGISSGTGGSFVLWYGESPYFTPGRYCGYV